MIKAYTVREPTIQRIPIDPDGRYVILAHDVDFDESFKLLKQFTEWYESDEQIFMMFSTGDTKFEFVKIEEA